MRLFMLSGAVAAMASSAMAMDFVATSDTGVLQSMPTAGWDLHNAQRAGSVTPLVIDRRANGHDQVQTRALTSTKINDTRVSIVAPTLDSVGGPATADDAPGLGDIAPATIVPSPGTLVLLGISGLIAFRRNR